MQQFETDHRRSALRSAREFAIGQVQANWHEGVFCKEGLERATAEMQEVG